MPAPLSQEQSAFVSSISSPSNILLSSCAGSGKTTAICAAAPPGAAVFSYNKSIAKELVARLPSSVHSSTTHSAGYSALARHTGKRLTLDDKKTWRIAGPLLGDISCPDLARAVDLAKSFAHIPPSYSSPLPSAGREAFLDFLSDYPLDTGDLSFDRLIDLVDEILLRSIKLCFAGVIDYSDMIYFPAIHRSRLLSPSTKSPFPLILIDECQDLNRAQRLLFASSGASQFAFVGDPGQAIYGFRGADHLSIEHLRDDFSCSDLSLTISFRCPQAIVTAAQPYYSAIFPSPSAPPGEVIHDAPLDPSTLRAGDAILCRNNAPLIRLAFQMISSGIPASVVGRDISGVISNTIKRAAKDSPTMPLREVLDRINNDLSNKISSARVKGQDRRVDALQDRLDCVFAVADSIKSPSPVARDLVNAVNAIFSDKSSLIHLSTIHKAKGLEWPRVHLLSFSLIGARAANEAQAKQERNLAYVAITRAKEKLIFLSS